MQRRGFLQALLAAAGGLAAARTATASLTPPQVAIKADTAPLQKSLTEAQAMVAEMLEECRVTEISRECRVDGLASHTITYKHAPNATRTPLDSQAREIVAQYSGPSSVTVSHSGDDSLDISELDLDRGWRKYSSPSPSKYEIIVEYWG